MEFYPTQEFPTDDISPDHDASLQTSPRSPSCIEKECAVFDLFLYIFARKTADFMFELWSPGYCNDCSPIDFFNFAGTCPYGEEIDFNKYFKKALKMEFSVCCLIRYSCIKRHLSLPSDSLLDAFDFSCRAPHLSEVKTLCKENFDTIEQRYKDVYQLAKNYLYEVDVNCREFCQKRECKRELLTTVIYIFPLTAILYLFSQFGRTVSAKITYCTILK